ncbi:DUF3280 domain-containing protein [Methylopila henanensis]|uniref:DUF3280 domain-containing protein n=1 Tax=Methylopila henanensis TaxID=873516 RepID=A0ABW4K5P8_9HYPH
MRKDLTCAALAAAAFVGLAGPAWAAPIKVAAFAFELLDTSAEGDIRGAARPDELRRIDQVSEQMRTFLTSKGLELVDVAPAQKDIDAQKLMTCGACPAGIAKTLGADYSAIGYVQKVSNLILNLNVEIRDARTGEVVRKGSADIRGNTEESWRHGLSYLMRHTILEQPLPPVKAP